MQSGIGGGGAFPTASQRHDEPQPQGLPLLIFALSLLALARPLPPRPDRDMRGGGGRGWRDRIRLPSLFAASPRRSAQAGSSPCLPAEPSTCPELPAPLPPPARPLCTGTSPPLGARNIPLLVLPRACHVLFTPTEDARRQKSCVFFFYVKDVLYFWKGCVSF